jgi:hypothetical protein
MVLAYKFGEFLITAGIGLAGLSSAGIFTSPAVGGIPADSDLLFLARTP